jgi:cytosine/adenosine deaminase-related metal-dependent hydrolase
LLLCFSAVLHLPAPRPNNPVADPGIARLPAELYDENALVRGCWIACWIIRKAFWLWMQALGVSACLSPLVNFHAASVIDAVADAETRGIRACIRRA